MSQPGAAQEEDPQPEHLFSKQLFRVQVSAKAWRLLQTCCIEYQESGIKKKQGEITYGLVNILVDLHTTELHCFLGCKQWGS